MTFPDVPTELMVEAELAGTWTDITSYVMGRDPVTISGGRADEAGQTDPSRLTMTINNRDGRFSPRNPSSPYFGQLGRNTPIRASVVRGPKFAELPGGSGDEVTAPDAVPLGITGDIDIRIDITSSSWAARNLAGKYKTTSNQRSWALQTDRTGHLVLAWSSLGTLASRIVAVSTAPIPLYPGRLAVRATLDVNNGASGNTATFYTSDSISGSWTQLGDPVITAGTTAIFDSSAPLEVGDVADLTGIANPLVAFDVFPLAGRVHGMELRSSIGGSIVANPDFTAQAAGTTTFSDTAAAPNTWTIQGDVTIWNRRWRFWGELASWPGRADISGRDIYVPGEAAGILRRLSQGTGPLRSTVYRGVLSEAAVIAYWPCEDASGATSLASALPGGQPMSITGTPTLASSFVFAASDALPELANSRWSGPVPSVVTGQGQVRMLLSIPAAGATNGAIVLQVITSGGQATRWDVVYTTAAGGTLAVNAYDTAGAILLATAGGGGFNGVACRVSLELVQNGADVTVTLARTIVGSSAGVGFVDTLTASTFGRIVRVTVDATSNIDDVTVGHISAHSAVTSILDLTDELDGYVGETAGRRVERLCAEEGVSFVPIGDLDDTAAMGVQRPAALVDLFRECVDADLGILCEPRDRLGIGYRARTSLYNQAARVALDYGDHELSDSLIPVDDDQSTRNDVTVSRTSGSSARAEQTTGPLSVADPPDGVGRYEDQATINVYADDQLPDQAGWRVHVGTVDEARLPQVAVNFAGRALVANATLVLQLLEAELGDRVTVDNPPSWMAPDQLSQLMQGTSETYTNFEFDMTLNCSPESPYRVGVLDETVLGKLDTDGSALAAGINSSAASVSVKTLTGPLWTVAAAEFPFDVRVGGEVMTVTNITGGSSPQTFTVTRSVNGVIKSHSTDDDVRLAQPLILAL